MWWIRKKLKKYNKIWEKQTNFKETVLELFYIYIYIYDFKIFKVLLDRYIYIIQNENIKIDSMRETYYIRNNKES